MDQSDDKRGERRNRSLKSARIVFNGGFSVMDCTVRNMSARGALIEMPSVLGVPTAFELVIDDVPRHARTVWKTDKRIGVRFGDRDEKEDAPAAVSGTVIRGAFGPVVARRA